MDEAKVRPQDPVDDFVLPWGTFAEFMDDRTPSEEPYLIDLGLPGAPRREWSGPQWRDLVATCAGRLVTRGVGKGSVVGVLAGNAAETVALAHSLWTIGAVLLPLNPADTAARSEFILRDSAAAVLVHDNAHAEAAQALAHAATLDSWPVVDLTSGPPSTSPPELGFADDQALQIYTSGTTGIPKAVSLTQRNLMVHTHGLSEALGWQAADRIMTVLPVHHVNGLLIGCLLPWHIGASTVLCDRFRSGSFWADATEEAATVSSVVPSLLEFLLADDARPQCVLREVLCGAGPLLPETALDFEDEFSVPVRHLYGLSETTAVATLMPVLPRPDRKRWYVESGFPSIGAPIPHVEVAVLDADGHLLPAGHRGQLAVRGATVMQQYTNLAPDDQPFDGSWFLTGDQGFWEPAKTDQHFFITGRLKELIIRGGVNLSPLEIDAVLVSHPQVRYGLAFGFDNRFYGEEVAAYVVKSGDVSAEEVLAHCAKRLGHAATPKVVFFGDDVPFTATGKARRLEVKNRLQSELRPLRDRQFRRHEP